MKRLFPLLVLCTLLSVAVPALASTWGGHNGDIRLSFTEGPEYRHVLESKPLPKVGVVIDLYAVLTGTAPIALGGETFLSVGGYELQLAVDGAEWKILSTDLPERALNASREPACLYVGKYAGMRFEEGGAHLVHWRIQVMGEPENVVFRLDPAGLRSCATLEGCPDSGTQALWTGSAVAHQNGVIFSAGYVPAYLNWTDGEPDLSPVRGEGGWADTDLFTID